MSVLMGERISGPMKLLRSHRSACKVAVVVVSLTFQVLLLPLKRPFDNPVSDCGEESTGL